MVAADTFRAAAVEQLAEWASRVGCEIVRQAAGSDPAAVVYDGIAAARSRGAEVVIVDTAGRLHTQVNLMNELAKVRRVIEKQIPGAPHETLLVIDATTGQNGLRQAQVFAEAVDVTGVVLTKLDGSAKGGIVIAIREELGIPIKLIGVGERLEDLRPFDPDEFARALFLRRRRGRLVSLRLETPTAHRARLHGRPISTTWPRSSPTPRSSGGSRSPSPASAPACGSTKRWATWRRDGTGRRAVVLGTTGKVIGGAGLVWRDLESGRELELGYHLHHGYWGRGYATEAGAVCLEHARSLGLRRRDQPHLRRQPALRGGRPAARHEPRRRARLGRPAASQVGRLSSERSGTRGLTRRAFSRLPRCQVLNRIGRPWVPSHCRPRKKAVHPCSNPSPSACRASSASCAATAS